MGGWVAGQAIVYLFERDSNESLRTADGKVTVMIDAGGTYGGGSPGGSIINQTSHKFKS